MYEVTATRKRPQLFETLHGQDFVVATIKNSVESGKIANAYLFSGPRGVGKTSAARILAKALNCIHGPTAQPCGVCSNCQEITHGNSLDVIEIDGASNTSVNDVRVIRDEILFPPQSGRYKIYIIDEVHMLSNSAFNALLKTIEEPPSYVLFIFATTENQKVPATIRSRCQQFHFQLLPLSVIKELLTTVAIEAEIEIEEEALFWIAKEATGSMRDAYTLFDQIAAFSGQHITLKKIEETLGLVGIEQLGKIVEMAANQQEREALLAVQQLIASGVSVEQITKDLAELFRSLLFITHGVKDENILALRVDALSSTLLTAFNTEQLEAALAMFLDLYRDIRFSLNPRFELELAISRLTALKLLSSSTTLMKRLEALQQNLFSGQVEPKEPVKSEQQAPEEIVQPKVEEPVKEEIQPVAKETKPVTIEILPAITQQLAIERNQLGIIMNQISDVIQSEDEVQLFFPTRYALETAKQEQTKIAQMIEQESGYRGKLSFVLQEPDNHEQETQQSQDEVVNLVKTIFRGDVV